MNRLALRRYVVADSDDEPFFGASDVIVPVIDSVPLYELLPERYFGVTLRDVSAGQWTGVPQYAEGEGVVILDGSCGVAGCCGVMARITLAKHTVTWDRFFARGNPSIPNGLKFVFDREQYETAIAAASELTPVEVTLDEIRDGE